MDKDSFFPRLLSRTLVITVAVGGVILIDRVADATPSASARPVMATNTQATRDRCCPLVSVGGQSTQQQSTQQQSTQQQPTQQQPTQQQPTQQQPTQQQPTQQQSQQQPQEQGNAAELEVGRVDIG